LTPSFSPLCCPRCADTPGAAKCGGFTQARQRKQRPTIPRTFLANGRQFQELDYRVNFGCLKNSQYPFSSFSLTLDDLTEITGFIAGVTQHSFLFLPVNDRVACDSLVNHQGGFSFSISFLASLNLA
jgi:hypothetical protein